MSSAVTDTADVRLDDWLLLIRAEYLEVPGLHLTLQQARRLWCLDEATSTALFSALVDARFLRQTETGAYVRADAG
jgi:hypothetical protein